MTYHELLRRSYARSHSNICLGLDPLWERLPSAFQREFSRADGRKIPDASGIREFLAESLSVLKGKGLRPAAFKPNIGYYQVLDSPLELDLPAEERFQGSILLAWLISFLRSEFEGVPIILDSKRGDIRRSSWNYAVEGFLNWNCDAVTVNPYMGADALEPFGDSLESGFSGFESSSRGVYSLLRTSNPGAGVIQNARIGEWGQPFYRVLGDRLLHWRDREAIPGLGAVAGATSPRELEEIAGCFARSDFPLLIPGVGSQGGRLFEVLKALSCAGYPVELARINLSSGLLQNWEGEAPSDWRDQIVRKMERALRGND